MQYGDLCSLKNNMYYYNRYEGFYSKITYRFRIDPVPFINKPHHGNVLRHMRTTQELRYNERDKEFVRASRNKRNLPNLYCDYFRDFSQKSWKDCTKRKKQWKPKKHVDIY